MNEENIYTDPNYISLVYICNLEKELKKRKLSRSDFAKMVGTSKSYLTQLWRGDKKVNMNFIAKVNEVLNTKTEIRFSKQLLTNK